MAPEERPPEPRRIELEVEVAGTPQEVWEAIATGPGISAWLHPTRVEERQGGRFSFDLGFGPQEGTVTAWDRPRRFAQEVAWDPAGDLPAARVATEWLVEARQGGTCLVRMVMSGFGAWVRLGRGGPLGLQAWWYGEDRAEIAAREQPAWAAWIRARFPASATPGRA